MASFPTSVPNLTNPVGADNLNSGTVPHATQHANANDEIEALATKLGTGSSTPSSNTVLRGTGAGASAFGQVAVGDTDSAVARQNLLVNSGFEIWQRGTGAFTANNAYTADCWVINLNGTSTISISRDSANADSGSRYCAAVTYTHNTTSYLTQIVEDPVGGDDIPYHTRGKTISLSIRVKTSTASAVKAFIWDGSTFVFSNNHTGGGAHETLTVTTTLGGAVTNLTVGVAFSVSCTAYVDNAMFVIGSAAPNHVPMQPWSEHERCRRYYEVMGGVAFGPPFVNFVATAGAQNLGNPNYFTTIKGGTPTLTKNGTWALTNAASQPTANFATVNGFNLFVASTAAGVTKAEVDSSDDTVTAEWNP